MRNFIQTLIFLFYFWNYTHVLLYTCNFLFLFLRFVSINVTTYCPVVKFTTLLIFFGLIVFGVILTKSRYFYYTFKLSIELFWWFLLSLSNCTKRRPFVCWRFVVIFINIYDVVDSKCGAQVGCALKNRYLWIACNKNDAKWGEIQFEDIWM